jgi:hypothetical protein
MEDIFAWASAAPILLSVVALITSILGVSRRAKAENEFVEELSKSIAGYKVVTDKAEFADKKYAIGEEERYIYHLYFSGVKGRGENKELPVYVKQALYNLNKSDKRYIVKALNQPSVKGRMRYFDKVLKSAISIIS